MNPADLLLHRFPGSCETWSHGRCWTDESQGQGIGSQMAEKSKKRRPQTCNILQPYGGFHTWINPNSWLVYFMENTIQMDEWGSNNPYFWKPPYSREIGVTPEFMISLRKFRILCMVNAGSVGRLSAVDPTSKPAIAIDIGLPDNCKSRFITVTRPGEEKWRKQPEPQNVDGSPNKCGKWLSKLNHFILGVPYLVQARCRAASWLGWSPLGNLLWGEVSVSSLCFSCISDF